MTRMLLVVAFVLAVVVCGGLAEARRLPSPEYQKVLDILNSKELSKEEKIARLKEMTGADDTRIFALNWLATLDEAEAVQASLAIFRAKEKSRELRLRMGHFLLEGTHSKSEGFPEGFIEEYAKYLVSAVLDGGQTEFCQQLEGLSPTAVGEYAYLASGFSGYQNVDFAPFKDVRLVPILIQCLNAPDNVYPKDQGDMITGKAGRATGRNLARQQIPVALAKLGDQRAVEPLKDVLFKHADIYLRMNAAYALAGLMEKKEDRAAVGKALLAKPDLLWCRLPFGKGLIEAGDDAGVDFLALQHAGGHGDGPLEYPSQIFSVINERLIILKGFKSPRVEEFVREALSLKPLHAMLLFEPGSAKIEAAVYYVKPPKDEAEALEIAGPRIIRIYEGLLKCVETNKLQGLSADLEEIAKKTRSEKIREMTNACLKSLAAPAAPTSRPAEIPAVDVLTPATREDMKGAASFAADATIQKAVSEYVAKPERRWKLVAARPVGDYVLLWVSFYPDAIDGGLDLVYSKKQQRIIGVFKGGERG